MLFLALFCLQLVACTAGKFTGWVDPDTTASHHKTVGYADGKTYKLVMSDEFQRPGRTFKDGHDPKWTGIDRSDDDQTNQGRKSLQFYNSSYVRTENGHLVITTTTEDTKWKGWNPYKKKYDNMIRHFRSGMVQSWNKFCFTGGIFEVRAQFPGRSDIGGLWPAVWLLGNLGRATFEASTNLIWPWSYNECDRSLQSAQEISACDITSHYGLNPHQGRGATEIDIIEVMAGPSTPLPIMQKHVRRPYNSMSLQIAPGIPKEKRRPYPFTLPEWGFNWYENLTYGHNTSINAYFYGSYLGQTKASEPVSRSLKESYQCDAISSVSQLNDSHFHSMHTFRLEWQPGPTGYLRWYMDGVFRFGIGAEGLRKQKTAIPNEPSYIIMNTAISTSWGFPNPPPGCTDYDCKDPAKRCGINVGWCETLPAQFKIDYVRVYQDQDNPQQTLGCNPREYPTKRFIAAHEFRYKALTDTHALKPILTGGGHCKEDSDCGDGTCQFNIFQYFSNVGFRGCKCSEDWQGPHCLVPTSQNDFPDWDVEPSWTLAMPEISPIFIVLVILLGVAVVGAVLFTAHNRKRSLYNQLAVSGLHQGSLRNGVYSSALDDERQPMITSTSQRSAEMVSLRPDGYRSIQ